MFDVWQQSARIGSATSVPECIMGLAYSHGQSAPFTKHRSAPTTTPDRPRDQQDFLMKLPFEERAVLHLIYAGGFSRPSIAGIMNTSCERVDVLLTDARRRLSTRNFIDD
jgi:DNA-directed RNA polymerase specialized sigma24 family protein